MNVFGHLLVPLDGSTMAEQAARLAVELARRCSARVTLLHVVEQDSPAQVHGQTHLRDAAQAQDYLRRLAGQLSAAGDRIDWHVHAQPARDTARGLGLHVEELHADLIVMCAHGNVRLRDRLLGNLGQQLAAQVAVPVLLLRAGSGQAGTFPFRRILVPLDGQAEHERGLAMAADLAHACQACIRLVTVVSQSRSLPAGQTASSLLLPGTTQRILDIQEQEATDYLSRHVRLLREGGLDASAQVRRGPPASEIKSSAQEFQADLIVLTTHGKAGTEAFWSRSLPPKLLRRIPTAFLLVPVER